MANPFGFRPARHRNGNNNFVSNTYQVDDSNPSPIYAGALCALSSGKVVEVSSTTTTPVLGVIKAVYTATKNRPKTHALPDGGNYIPASAAGWVDVYDDPDIIFEGVADGALSLLGVGQVGRVTANGGGRTSTGRSLQQLDASSFATETSANTESLPVKMIGLSKKELDQQFKAGQIVEFIINNHEFRRRKT